MTNAVAPHNNSSGIMAFLKGEAGGGVLLMAAAALAMILANSAWTDTYFHTLHAPVGPILTEKLGPMTPHLWINDGLMAIFFFLVGLEIKREFLDGRLSTWDKRRLPIVAAAAGMFVPAAVYLLITSGEPALQNGWAIPAATDIAFALGVLALLGRRAPTSLKLFLLTVAIVDDMGAVAIIAVAYTVGLKTTWLLAAAAVMAVMYVLNMKKVYSLWPYILLAIILWYTVLMSGVHATIAGVLAAMMVPIIITPGAPDAVNSPLHRMEHAIHPWSAYLIIPIFGFANAGVAIDSQIVSLLLDPLPLGVAAGLFLGKQLGIFTAIWVAVKSGFASKPRGATWLQIYGVGMLCGIGFTMSLFIGELAFPGSDAMAQLYREEAKVGILMGSLLSAIVGYTLLRFAPLHPMHDAVEAEQAAEIAREGDIDTVEEDEKGL